MKYILLFPIIVFLCTSELKANSGSYLTYFPFNSNITFGLNIGNKFSFEGRVASNKSQSCLNMGLAINYYAKKTENFNIITGAGFSYYPFYSIENLKHENEIFCILGLRFKPFEKIANLQLVFEILPFVTQNSFLPNIKSNFGIAWNFNKKSIKK